MAGHSHSANIAIRKGAVDKKRGKLFGKFSRLIMVAARHGGPDPTTNLALRYAIDKAKKSSMPKENIERAVKKGSGENGGELFEELLYEGYGPNGVAVLCEVLTDNRNRTAGEIRWILDTHGGNLGASGCVGWMFDRKGLFTVPKSAIDEDRLMEVALEAGADDVSLAGEVFEVTCKAEAFQIVNDAFTAAKIPTEYAEVIRIPSQMVDLDEDNCRSVLKLIDALEDNDDVQTVTANFNMPAGFTG